MIDPFADIPLSDRITIDGKAVPLKHMHIKGERLGRWYEDGGNQAIREAQTSTKLNPPSRLPSVDLRDNNVDYQHPVFIPAAIEDLASMSHTYASWQEPTLASVWRK